MIKIQTPATSANLGPGFDCLGLALSLYNTFSCETSSSLHIEGCPKEFCTEDNLFHVAYQAVLKKIHVTDSVHVKIDSSIPVSRGLGSSASLLVAGAYAANVLHNSPLSTQDLFELCTQLEGHPDNIAPCLFGGFTISTYDDAIPHAVFASIHSTLRFSVLIPDCAVSTAEARKILPKEVSLSTATHSVAHALTLVNALSSGDEDGIRLGAKDVLHEPYRSTLIPNFHEVKKICLDAGGIALLISGSGSTCLCIHKEDHFSSLIQPKLDLFPHNWKAIDVEIDTNGVRIQEENNG